MRLRKKKKKRIHTHTHTGSGTHTNKTYVCVFFFHNHHHHHYHRRHRYHHSGSPGQGDHRFCLRRRVVAVVLCACTWVGAAYNHTLLLIYNIIYTTVYATGLIKWKFSIKLLPHPYTHTHKADETSL